MLPSQTRSIADLVARGRALFSEGRLSEAREAFASVLRTNPAHAESLIFQSRIAFESGDTFTGAFQAVSLEYAGDHNGERTYSLRLESSGAVTFNDV